MAEDDEIDILGDFSFNSCFAQNNQGIPSCSDREDTVHPQWLLDSTANNWYDLQNKDFRIKDGPSRKLSGNSTSNNSYNEIHTTWTQTERELLKREMAKYGRNIFKISQTITTKTEAEIQALIEAEHGVHLETPCLGLAKVADQDETPTVVQEEIVAEEVVNMNDVLDMVSTGSPTVPVSNKPFRRKNHNVKNKSLSNCNVMNSDKTELLLNPSDIVYDDDITIGSTQSIGAEVDKTDLVAKNLAKQQKEKIKALKKIGNHRRKVSRSYDKGKSRNWSKDTLKSPQGRQRKDSSLSEDSVKSPKMQLVFSSGQALPVSEGEEVIKIEKKSEAESDEEIDVDSDKEVESPPRMTAAPVVGAATDVRDASVQEPKPKSETVPAAEPEPPVAVPLGRFEPLPKRNRKINLDGGGGCTIMHTAAGDLYEVRTEPRKGRAPRKAPVHLIPCRVYNSEKPAPCEVSMQVSTLMLMDVHAHTSRGEVMGLLGGRLGGGAPRPRLLLAGYERARAASAHTHCDMDPVSQAAAAARLRGAGLAVCGWHHSHPRFAARPSAQDLRSQRALQRLAWRAPCLALVTSQHWPPGRAATHYRCFRVEDEDEETDPPIGYQFSVKLVADLNTENLDRFLADLREMVQDLDTDDLSVNMNVDVCPQAGFTYLEKCISSVSHHMRSAGYADQDPLVKHLLQGIRDIFR